MARIMATFRASDQPSPAGPNQFPTNPPSGVGSEHQEKPVVRLFE
jgi:hypothetical protein